MRMLAWPVLAVFLLTVAWVALRGLTAAPPDIDSAIQAIHQDGNTPWRAAILLEALRQPSGADMRADPALARRISQLLEHELDTKSGEGDSGENAATVRIYLCRALAQFEVAEGLPVLLRVVKNQTHTTQADERRTAIEAVAALTSHIQPRRLLATNRVLIPSLLDAAASPDPQVRAAAAYALGVYSASDIPTHAAEIESARTKLKKLLHDATADVRYNAATGLARSGNAACEAVLLEMLDPRETATANPQTTPADTPSTTAGHTRQETVLLSAIAASELLIKNNPQLDSQHIQQAISRLADVESDAPQEPRRRATELLKQW